MKEFFVGVLVLMMMAVLLGLGILLLPFLLVLGIFLRIFLGFFLFLFAIWAVGKVTLLLIHALSPKNEERPNARL